MTERALPVTILEPAGIDPDLLDHSLSLRFDLGQFDPRITFTRNSSATYFGSDGLLKTAAANEPRIDYNPLTGESLGLLIEEQRTNLLLRSDTLVSSYSGNGLSFESAVGPTGEVVTWAKLQANAVGGAWCYTTYSYATSTAYTLSVFVKSLDGNPPAFGSSSAPSIANSFALVVFGTALDPLSYKVQSLGNGVYRVHASITSPTTISNINTGVAKYQGNDARAFMFTGFQLEAGAFPTSYIRTLSTAVTRAADNATMTGENFSSWYRADEGTLFAEASSYRAAYSGTAVIWDGTSANRIDLSIPGTSGGVRKRFTIFVNGAVTADFLPTATVVPSTFYRGVGAYKVNDIGAYSTDSTITTDNSSAVPVVNRLSIGGRLGGSEYQNGHIKRVAYYPKRLTNAKLQALTA